jgi:hypothetical protein
MLPGPRTRAEATMGVFGYIESWYNLRRRHSALGYESPVSFERKHGPAAVTPSEGSFSPLSTRNPRAPRKPTRHDAPGATIAVLADLRVPPISGPAATDASSSAGNGPGSYPRKLWIAVELKG